MNTVIDVNTNQPTDDKPSGGVMGQISWRRLRDVFKEAGVTAAHNEKITHFVITDNFLQFYVDRS